MNFVFGFRHEKETVNDKQLNGNGDFLGILHQDSFKNTGFFLQDEWEINDRLEFVPGLRFDKANTLENGVISPRIAASYIANSDCTLRANYSSGFLAPRIFDEDLHIENIGGVPRDIVNAENLREERSHTFSIGADLKPSIFNGRLVTAVQVYHTILENSFDLDEGTIVLENGREKIERINTAGSTINGVELDLNYSFHDHWYVNAGIAYSKARFNQEDPDRGTNRYNKTPDWSGVFQLNYDNDEKVDGFLAIKWTGKMLVDRLDSKSLDFSLVEETPQFFVIDLGISKAFMLTDSIDLTIRVGINNLLDDYQENLESGYDRDRGYVYGPRHPRTYTIGARFDFEACQQHDILN